MIISLIVGGESLRRALAVTLERLQRQPGHEETFGKILQVEELLSAGIKPAQALPAIGPGWIAEECLAAALYCVLYHDNFRDAVLAAVNAQGDRDTVGSVCGALAGAIYGIESIPVEWVSGVEKSDEIAALAGQYYDVFRFDR